jgi:phytoene/squalene synthetase
MSLRGQLLEHPPTAEQGADDFPRQLLQTPALIPDAALPERITRDASKQAYYTVRYLVDREHTAQAYRAYAYFRWVDDMLDLHLSQHVERRAFVDRQQRLLDSGYRNDWQSTWRGDLAPEERLLAYLIQGDDEAASGLQSYIRNMMAVMDFDVDRRGRLITSRELDDYTRYLATAATDALHYFIGHDQAPPRSAARYLAATGAHITHMLRDTYEDAEAGYFNVPSELLESCGLAPRDIASEPYRAWVRGRVCQARACFRAGAVYLDHVKSLRCRIAGHAYMARFVGILGAIERDGYLIRPSYPEFKHVGYGLRMGSSVVAHAVLRGNQ